MLTVIKADLGIKADDLNKPYGTDDPELTYQITSGSLFGDDALSGSLSRIPGENVGAYTIEQNTLTAGDNYDITFNEGVLTITKAILTVTANDQVIFAGDPLPKITFSYDGFVFGETEKNVFGDNGPGYVLDPPYKRSAGIYKIIPSGVATNYKIVPVNGTLYVNPAGIGAMPIIPILICVEKLPPGNSGYLYIAHFIYANINVTAVYVPIGVNNKVVSNGKFQAVNQPQLFLHGKGYFDVYFDGTKLYWYVSSLKSCLKIGLSAEASSKSFKCLTKKSLYISDVEESVQPDNDVFVYPNPVIDKVTIRLDEEIISDEAVVIDVLGKLYSVPVLRIGEDMLELDLSNLNSGLYLIKVKTSGNYKMFHIIKQ
jgi:hypothetical protein